MIIYNRDLQSQEDNGTENILSSKLESLNVRDNEQPSQSLDRPCPPGQNPSVTKSPAPAQVTRTVNTSLVNAAQGRTAERGGTGTIQQPVAANTWEAGPCVVPVMACNNTHSSTGYPPAYPPYHAQQQGYNVPTPQQPYAQVCVKIKFLKKFFHNSFTIFHRMIASG